MKKYSIRNFAPFLAALLCAACGEYEYENSSPFANGVYIDAAQAATSDNVTFKKTVTELTKSFSARLSYPAKQDVSVTFAVDVSLADAYNRANNTAYGTLGGEHYSLPEQGATIPAGDVASPPLTLDLTALDKLEIDATYLLPLTIEAVSGGVDVLQGSRTLYYLVRRSSAITMAANIRDNYFAVPGFDSEDTSDVVDNMPAITFEAIIYVEDFAYGGPLNPGKAYISTVMGCEQHFLMRIGDSDFPLEQLQMQGPAGKFPEADNSKLLEQKMWYHVALTWDIAAQTIVFYVNGQEQSRSESYAASEVNSISLKKSEHGFYIGRSFNDDMRQLNGNIAEVRVWSVARTGQQIWESMYDVDPQTPGLAAYWKFDQGQGNISTDLTGNGNDAIAAKEVFWPQGIEIPQLNKVQ